MPEADRFELERAIQACWGTKEDLELIYEDALEGESSKEDIANAILGLIALHEMRSSKAFRIFEELVREGFIFSPFDSDR